MAELADAPDLGSGVLRRAGSSPVIRILPILNPKDLQSHLPFPLLHPSAGTVTLSRMEKILLLF